MKKIITRIINIVLGVVLVTAIGVLLMSTITSRSNNGVPNFFGNQVMVVKSDSMAPTLKVNSSVIVKKVPIEELKPQVVDEDGNIEYEGDIVSYVNSYGLVITHRLIDIDTSSDGRYILTAVGENADSNQCTNHPCVYTPEQFYENRYMGKVVSVNAFLGNILTFMTNRIVTIFLIGVPIAYIAVSLIVDFVRSKKDDGDDEGENKESESA